MFQPYSGAVPKHAILWPAYNSLSEKIRSDKLANDLTSVFSAFPFLEISDQYSKAPIPRFPIHSAKTKRCKC